jgi:hypothetical protein
MNPGFPAAKSLARSDRTDPFPIGLKQGFLKGASALRRFFFASFYLYGIQKKEVGQNSDFIFQMHYLLTVRISIYCHFFRSKGYRLSQDEPHAVPYGGGRKSQTKRQDI